MKQRWPSCAVILPAFVLTLASTLTAAEKPNVVLIVADDLGYSDLGCYGGEIETPHLDALAAAGIRLTRFYNMGRCCPSRACILTGQYPHRVGLGHMTQDIGRPGYRGRLSEDAQTIAQVLAEGGYRSFLSGKWHLGTEDPTRHGFEEFYGTLVSAKTFWDPDHFLRLPKGHSRREYEPGTFYATDAVTDHAIDFLDQARETPDRPWFLYLAYNAPHFPLQAPKNDIAKYADRYHDGWDIARTKRLNRMKKIGIVPKETELTPRSPWWDYGEVHTGTNPAWKSLPEDRRADLARRMAIYAAMVDRMDQNIGRVVNDLKKAGELENTVIIFLSDNGACAEWDPHGFDIRSSPNNILHTAEEIEKMGEPGTFHSAGSGWANASNTPWRLYKHFCHEGGIASPCIVHYPSRFGRGGAIDHRRAHIIDLLPAIAELAGVEYQGRLKLPGSGTGLIRQLEGRPDVLRSAFFFEHEGNRAVLFGKWKLVGLKDQPWELYDLSTDRTELRNLITAHQTLARALRSRWEKWARENLVTPLPTDYQVPYLKPAPPDESTGSAESN